MIKSLLIFSILLLMIIQNSCAQEHKHTNKLIAETSPYLLQHAHNPVNWYPYGEEAFAKAREEDKLILFSIGYAACHWCHVMEHESFEDEAVAKIMNENFICIKVDKEERPDVDQIYMNAVHLITGSGGWPLNCFALPDGRPVWGGTYFRSNEWINILENLSSTYKKDKAKFERSAKELTRGIVSNELISSKAENKIFTSEEFETVIAAFKQRFDYRNGGFIGQPKFPMPGLYDFMLDYALLNKDGQLLEHISLTLKKWAYGGIYDQLGGGFSRYSVDSKWLIPHFEKMLYDNGQILSLYAKMYRITKEPVFKRVIEETTDWVQRDLIAENKMFYASFDADSEGEEGTFYVWTKDEVEDVLGADADEFCNYYGITSSGNFEAKNILNVESMEEPSEKILELKLNLFKYREKREKPGLDNKTLSSWNALMISGLCESFLALSDQSYLDIAESSAESILKNHIDKKGNLLRIYKKNNSVMAFMDDYALVIKAFLDLYKLTFNDKWLENAIQLTEKANTLFFDSNSGMYFYTALNENVIVRKMEISDNVIPASNSVMANNLFELSRILDDNQMLEMAIQMAKNTKQQSLQSSAYSYNWLALMQALNMESQEIVFIGQDALKKRNSYTLDYYPNVLITGSLTKNDERPLLKNRYKKDETLIYQCINKACKMPVKDL